MGKVIGEWLVGCLVGGSDIPEYLSHVCDWLIAHVYPLVTCKTCKPLNHLEPVLQTQLFTIWVCLIIKMLQVEPEAEDSCLIFEGVVKQKLGVCVYIYKYIYNVYIYIYIICIYIFIYLLQSNIGDADICTILHHISVVLYMRSGSGKPKTA